MLSVEDEMDFFKEKDSSLNSEGDVYMGFLNICCPEKPKNPNSLDENIL